MANITQTKRSISYPSITLEEAIKRAEQFWNAEKKNAAPVEAAVTHWNYSQKSSGGKLVVAALISYGLMIDSGSNQGRQVQLTARALDILLSLIDSPERIKALQEAVKSPKIYNDLLTKWDAANLPSDHTIKSYLIKDKDFNANTVDAFIKDFRVSVSYAKLDSSSYSSNVNDISSNTDNIEETPALNEVVGNLTKSLTLAGSGFQIPSNEIQGMRHDVFALSEGNVVMQWPEKMSAESYEDFKDWVELMLRKIKRVHS